MGKYSSVAFNSVNGYTLGLHIQRCLSIAFNEPSKSLGRYAKSRSEITFATEASNSKVDSAGALGIFAVNEKQMNCRSEERYDAV